MVFDHRRVCDRCHKDMTVWTARNGKQICFGCANETAKDIQRCKHGSPVGACTSCAWEVNK